MTLVEELMAQGYPAPNIRPVSEEEDEMLMNRLHEYGDADDFESIARMVQEIPIAASTLDDLKKFYGLGFLLERQYNLYEAVKTYGKTWLEK